MKAAKSLQRVTSYYSKQRRFEDRITRLNLFLGVFLLFLSGYSLGQWGRNRLLSQSPIQSKLPIASSTSNEFKGWVNDLSVRGGVELTKKIAGANQLTRETRPQGDAFVTTNANFHGGVPDRDATAAELRMEGVKVNVNAYRPCFGLYTSTKIMGNQGYTTQDNSGFMVEQYGNEGGFSGSGPDPLAQIASETGGHFFQISPSETEAVFDILFNEAFSPTDFVRFADEVFSTSAKTYSISIDSTTIEANFLLDAECGNVNLILTNPNGSVVNPIDPGVTYIAVGNAQYYLIENPLVGLWQVQLSGDGYSFSQHQDIPR